MSVEFLLVFAVLLVAMTAFFVIYSEQKMAVHHTGDILVGTRNAYATAAAINYVYLAGEGASYNFTVSGKSVTENLTVSEYGVQSNRTHTLSYAPLLTGNVTEGEIDQARIMIINRAGGIEIE